MIVGIGTDLCQAERMERAVERETFLQGVFSPAEQELLSTRTGKRRAQTAAANFAAKEAFLKACGRGLGGFALADIAVLRKESGAPYFRLSGGAAAWVEENRLVPHLSLTHDAGLASAFVVLEQREGGIG